MNRLRNVSDRLTNKLSSGLSTVVNPKALRRPLPWAVSAVFLLGVWLFLYTTSRPTLNLHLLVPATSTNPDLCKSIFSSSVLEYPKPVLINWNATEDADEYKQHLAKVGTILDYLNQLSATNSEHDLVFIIDGYDAWFQLPPEVLIKRYFAINEAANLRTKQAYGPAYDHYGMQQTILFGADKLCWPVDFHRPACWAVPRVPMDDYAFGPPRRIYEHHMPRWLNSGTILGPLGHLIRLFEDTLDESHRNYVFDSDQYYFAELFGAQEYSRLTSRPDLLRERMQTLDRAEISPPPGDDPPRSPPKDVETQQHVEYHIGIDYDSGLFQTLAFYKQFLTFMRWDYSWRPDTSLTSSSSGINEWDQRFTFDLPADLVTAPSPYWRIASKEPWARDQSWGNAELLLNPITNQVPVTIHFTLHKDHRFYWWKKMWFQPHARALKDAISAQKPQAYYNKGKPIAGRRWRPAAALAAGKWKAGVAAEASPSSPSSSSGEFGAWSDNGEWLSWDTLCRDYDNDIFG